MPTKTKCFIPLAGSFLFCLCCSITHGQIKNEGATKLYVEAGGGITNNQGSSGDLAIQGILKDRWVATLSYQKGNMHPKNLPKDYDPGTATVFFVPINVAPPNVDMQSISFTGGRSFKTGRNTWFTTEAGLSFASLQQFTFTKSAGSPSDPGFSFFGFGGTDANYTYTIEKKKTIGAMIKTDFNWAFASFIGVGAGVFANFNSIQSPVGFRVKVIVGKLSRERR